VCVHTHKHIPKNIQKVATNLSSLCLSCLYVCVCMCVCTCVCACVYTYKHVPKNIQKVAPNLSSLPASKQMLKRVISQLSLHSPVAINRGQLFFFMFFYECIFPRHSSAQPLLANKLRPTVFFLCCFDQNIFPGIILIK